MFEVWLKYHLAELVIGLVILSLVILFSIVGAIYYAFFAPPSGYTRREWKQIQAEQKERLKRPCRWRNSDGRCDKSDIPTICGDHSTEHESCGPMFAPREEEFSDNSTSD